ncbi:hypothetical protein [[Kitasatospora] papulosa]|uniref:hypothetical protein n=1 Tax=[Kitasatospora] papulosa TaxID=1464011 RepID=UPI0038675A06
MALRRRFVLERWKRAVLGFHLGVLIILAALAPLVFMPSSYNGAPPEDEIGTWSHLWRRVLMGIYSTSPSERSAMAEFLFYPFVLLSVTACVFAILLLLGGGAAPWRGMRARSARLLLARRYLLVSQCVDVIHLCAAARRGGEGKAANLRTLTKKMKVVRRGILDAHKDRGVVPRFGLRSRVVRQHERRVAAALQALEFTVDRDPDVAMAELTDHLLLISDRYCEARVGALLDEEQLQGIPEVHDRTIVRYVGALLLAASAISGLAVSGVLPEGPDMMVYLIIFSLCMTIAFGRNIRRNLEVLGALTGGI